MFDKLLPKNVHVVERAARVVLGLFVLSLVFWGPHTLWGLAGLVPLVTGLAGTCPIYTLLGIDTCRRSSHKREDSQSAHGV